MSKSTDLKMSSDNKEIPFLLTPIFQHGPTEAPSDERSKRQQGKKNIFKRRILDRIVTPIPYRVETNAFDSKAKQFGGDDLNGEVEVCMEDVIRPDGATSSQQPLLRRVVVRSYGGISFGYNDSSMNESQDVEGGGVLHASFSIPFRPLPMDKFKQGLLPDDDVKRGECFNQGRGESNNWLCWTSFNSVNGGGGGNGPDGNMQKGKSYLCALTSPSTIRIFDVYPNPHRKSSDPNTESGTSSVGEGYTVSLPFEASSIFALPLPQCGLLIQRAPRAEDFLYIGSARRFQNASDDYYPRGHELGTNGSKIGSVTSSSDMNSQDRNKMDFIIQPPPATIRIGRNLIPQTLQPLQPRMNNYVPAGGTLGGTDGRSSPHSSTSEDMSIVNSSLPPPFEPMPSLYTLHHPLDEPRPCLVSPRQKDDEQRGEKNEGQNVFRMNDNMSQAPREFANAHEKVLFVGKPRFFTDTHGTNLEKHLIIVTFNSEWKRHAIWILQDAPLPPPPIPLWKQVSKSKQERGMDVGGEWYDIQNGVVLPKDIDYSIDEEEEKKIETDATNTPSPFSKLYAKASLQCIYGGVYNDSSAQAECPAREVFLSTNFNATGDFNICMLQPRLAGKGQQEQKDNHVLRCITLQPLGVSVGWKWQVSNYFDITCISALPIKSIPIAPSPIGLNADFSRVSDPKISRKQRNHIDEPYFAIDILLCKHGEKEEIGMPTELNIFRESNHIVLCSVPKSSSTLTSSYNSLNQFYLNNTLSAIGLRYSVNDRIDVLCRDLTNSQNVHTINVRVKVSLSFKKCPVAEDALLAVSSACLSHRDEIDLAFQLRSDCCRLSQALSILGEQNLDDDVEWSAFSSVLTQFMKVSTKKMLSRNNDVQISSAEIAGENSDDDSAWECLLKSDFNRNYVGENENHMFLISANDTEMKSASLKHESSSIHPVSALISSFTKNKLVEGGDLLEVATKIFDAMHLAYEEGKIKKSSVDMSSLRKLGQLLYEISVRGGDLMMDYSAHYTRDLYDLLPNEDDCTSNNTSHRLSKYRNPPCFFSWLESLTKAEFLTDNLPSTLNGMCATMSRSFHFLSILYFPKSSQQQKERDRLLVSSMVKEGFIDADRLLEKLPTGVALPIMDALLRCRSDPPPPFSSGFTSDAYELIGRPDLAQMQLSAETNIIKKSKPREDSAQTELPHANYLYAEDSPEVTNSLPSDDVEKDGLVSIERFSAMLFPDDNRVREAARLLRSSRRTFLRVHRPVEMSDHDYERLKQEKLGHLCRRVVALPLGRGMMTIGTFEPLPAEPLPMPTLCLSGRVPPLNATLLLDTTNWDEDSKMWPEFHNGVAAGLRLPQMGTNKMNELARTWIVYNKPVSRQSEQTDNASNANNNQNNESPHTTSHEHGGFLMALGLRGHLSALSMTDICDYLTQGSVTTAVGILLGVAANRRGTCDLSISKTLCLHVPSLLPPSFATIDVAAPIQAAAVAGIGLLYQGSSHRLMTEFLINEMGKRPTNDQNNSSRESYNLCCGLALGMVNLHCGADDAEMNRSGLSDLRIDERLHRYIVGGTDDRYQNERHDSFERQNNNNAPGSEQEKCSTIYEGDMINTGITAPGAMLALGMIHMKSGNKSIASRLEIPDTIFLLDYVRPDFLFFRVMSKALVLWDNIEPTNEWIHAQIPSVVQRSYEGFRKASERTSGLAGLVTFAAMSMSEEKTTELESENAEPQNNSNDQKDREDSIQIGSEVDRQEIRQAHAYIVSGACFAIGLRYAGTGNELAATTIYQRLLDFQKLRDESDPVSIALRPERPLLEMCLGSISISLALVMAGTGDVRTLQMLKILRWKCDDNVKYGNHMAYGAAIGLLFLGGGSVTLGREPSDIAALIAAFFPRFPATSIDNQYHLQALRHFYALAVRNRKIEAVDIDSREKIFVPIEINYEGQDPVKMRAPCLLLDKGRVTKICVKSDRYYPVEVDCQRFYNLNSNLNLFVKKKSGHLSYTQDPHSLRSLLIDTGNSANESALEMIQAFTENSKLLAFAKYLCNNQKHVSKMKTKKLGDNRLIVLPETFDEFSSRILHECLTKEKPEAIFLNLRLYEMISSLPSNSFPIEIIWNLRILRCYYESQRPSGLVSSEFIAILCQSIDKFFSTFALDGIDESSYDTGEATKNTKQWLGSILVWNSITNAR